VASPVVLTARGHPQVAASHAKTLEVTRDPDLTERGTCILGVDGRWDDTALLGLRGRQRITLRVGARTDELEATVSPGFLGGPSLVVRRGDDLADRTFAYAGTKGAAGLDRDLVAALRQPDAVLEVTLTPVGGEPPPGVLYVVGLPIGNHEDLTPRGRAVLVAVDVVLAEDTRRYRTLARDLGLTARDVRSHHLGNEAGAADALVEALAGGARVALVSDAGTPVVSDPGYPLVRRARQAGVTVRPVPGPSAPVVALSAAGIPADLVTFAGFLPRRAAARRAFLADLGRHPGALVVFEAPHRLAATLADLDTVLPGRELCVGRELTKIHEELAWTTTGDAAEALGAVEPRGEYTLVIGPAPAPAAPTGVDDDTVQRLVRALGDTVPTRTLADALATATGLSRRDAYRAVLALRDTDDDPAGDEGDPPEGGR